MKTTTKFALAAVASALMGSSALAADLGGSCCADLEERIAELEATTVRKGNRKVSVQLSGFVGSQVLWWDDGSQSDAYIGMDGGNIFSRWRLRGSAKISPELTAGFTYEFGVNRHSITSSNQGNGGPSNPGGGPGGDDTGECSDSCLRDSTVWLRHSRLGMVKIGQGSTSTDNLILIDLGKTGSAATPDARLYMGSFSLRANDGTFGATSWVNAIRGTSAIDTDRLNHVLYETPSLAGFTLQAAVAEDNFWDIALRYAGEFNGVRIAFGIGYLEESEYNQPGGGITAGATSVACVNNCDVERHDLLGSASILHVPTGLFLTGAAGTREMEGHQVAGNAATAYTGPDMSWWYLTGGINKNFFGIGATVIGVEYLSSEGGLEQWAFQTRNAQHINNTVASGNSSSEAEMWGIYLNQYIDAAAMEMFITYKNFSLDANGFTGASAPLNTGNSGAADFSMVLVGTKINF